MAFLSKYGVARHIYIPMVKRAVVDFAVGADWTPAGGDVKISKDGGAAANVTNLPTAIAMGNGAIWDFSLTATEMQAAQIDITIADSATKAVEDNAFIIETYGNASGQHAVDLSDSVRAGLTALPNAAANAAGGLPVSTAGGLDLDEMNVDIEAIQTSTAVLPGSFPTNFSALSITAAGLVAVTSGVKKNAARAAFPFEMTDSSTHAPKTGLTVTATRSLDGAAYAGCANSVTELSNGTYLIDLAATDLNANTVMLRFTATAADDLQILIITQP